MENINNEMFNDVEFDGQVFFNKKYYGIIQRCFDFLIFKSKILKNALSFDVRIIIETSYNFGWDINTNLEKAAETILNKLILIGNKNPELYDIPSKVKIIVSNVIYDPNPPAPIFKPLFYMGNCAIGSYDGEIWTAKEK